LNSSSRFILKTFYRLRCFTVKKNVKRRSGAGAARFVVCRIALSGGLGVIADELCVSNRRCVRQRQRISALTNVTSKSSL
jgi:hypothetical protein